ncbi:MAG: alpha/beta fold hydrolase [Acidimicrobiales bacterium]|nr:alpha/beta fold hydrolase [Acidimicrobiales bacterium]
MRRKLFAFWLAFALAALAVPSALGAATPPKNPVIIVAGTLSPAIANEPLAARMRADGWKVWIFQLPGLGLGDIHQTAAALGPVVDSVRAQTGSAKVDLVGHSQGGLVARDYVKSYGGSTKVDKVIGLGAPNYGTAVANLATFLGLGDCLGVTACAQMAVGSSYLASLNAGDDSIGSVRYYNIATKLDELVQPYSNAFLNAADGNIYNAAIQDQCWLRVVGHAGLILDGTAYSGVKYALEGNAGLRFNCWAL